MSSSRNKRRKQSKQTKLTCMECKTIFHSVPHYKKHMLASSKCRDTNPYCCKFCDYMGFDSNSLNQHLMRHPSCTYHYNQLKVTTGLLPDINENERTDGKINSNTSTYAFTHYSADGEDDTVHMNVHDNCYEVRRQIQNTNSDNLLTSFTQNRLLACSTDVKDNNDHDQCSIAETSDSDDDNVMHLSPTTISTTNDIRQEQDILSKRFADMNITKTNEMQLDLFHLLKASNCPLVMYDRIFNWVRRHESTISTNGLSGINHRDKFISEMNGRLYNNTTTMKPIVNHITLSSGRQTNVVTFSLSEMILKMVSNRSLFIPDNLLLNPDDPCGDPLATEYYSDVNSGSWFKQAKTSECHSPNHILMPFCHFIDGLNVDKYGKLTVEAVMTCCLWYNRKARNRSSTWWVQGFVEDQKLFRDQDSYVRNDKAQDYHDMLACIFREMKEIRENGGLKLSLNFGGTKKYDVIAIPVIQFIIGDCKGNDLLCGRKGGHSLLMNGLCRDCDVKPELGDDTCIDRNLMCKFITKDDVAGKDAATLNENSFLPINNCFHDISFGGCDRNVYGATPAELLHAVLLGLCEYIAEGMELLFTQGSLDLISAVVIGIHNDSRRQSERDMPDIGPFRNGLMSVKSLKAKERFTRIYCVYLAFLNSHLISELTKKKRKRCIQQDNDTFLSLPILFNFFKVIEDTLLFYLWLKKDHFLKEDFEVRRRDVDSKASKRIKEYLESFKKNIVRGGNNLKTPKFHQMLHITDYIVRHGCPMNYDGGRGENFGKIKIKDNARLTNRQKATLNYDIGRRISEEDVIDQASNVYFQQKGYWPSKYCNETDIMMNANRIQRKVNHNHSVDSEVNKKSRYKLVCSMNTNEQSDDLPIEYDIVVDWGGQKETPYENFPTYILHKLVQRLYVGSPNIGGRIAHYSEVKGYTELRKDGILYRAHPYYKLKGSWFDWGLFNWTDCIDPIPAQIIMMLDLRECTIIEDVDANPDTTEQTFKADIYPHLTQDIWVVVLAAKNTELEQNPSLNNIFVSKIATCFEMHDDNDVFIIPWSTLIGPCFVIKNNNYMLNSTNESYECDQKARMVLPMRDWGDKFL